MKTVIVTGGSRGIGKAIAIKFATQGDNVILNYEKSEETANKLASEFSNIYPFKADISNKKAVFEMVDYALSKFQKIDILINNAGISSSSLLQDLKEEELKRLFDVNVFGTIYASQAVLPNMLSRHEGKIINISSIWGMVGAANEVAYSASKAAIIGFTKALAKEVGPSNIYINCVAPGIIMTDMVQDYTVEEFEQMQSNIPLERIGSTEDVANLVYFLSTDEANYITGQVISPNGGWVI